MKVYASNGKEPELKFPGKELVLQVPCTVPRFNRVVMVPVVAGAGGLPRFAVKPQLSVVGVGVGVGDVKWNA